MKYMTLALMERKQRRMKELADKVYSASDDVKRWTAEIEELATEIQELGLRMEDGEGSVEL